LRRSLGAISATIFALKIVKETLILPYECL
jgi:hypothetical protein